MMTPERARGAAAVEVAVLVPLVLMLVVGVVTVWRVWWTSAQLTSATAAAAWAGARAATTAQARTIASQVLAGDLAAAGITCQNSPVMKTLTPSFEGALKAGQSGTISITTTCTVPLHQVGLPGLPGSVTVRAAATEAIDTYQEHGI